MLEPSYNSYKLLGWDHILFSLSLVNFQKYPFKITKDGVDDFTISTIDFCYDVKVAYILYIC